MYRRRIKILQVITRLVAGGAQDHMISLCDLLDKTRFDVTILSGAQTDSGSDQVDVVTRKGINLKLLPELTRQINPALDLLAMLKMTAYIKRHRFDIVHTNSSKAGVLGRVAARLAGARVVLHTVHGWPYHAYMDRFRRTLYMVLERIVEKFTDGIITVSESDFKKGLGDNVGSQNKYCVIRSGIDLDKFSPSEIDVEREKKKWNLKASDKVVGTVTRLVEQKSPGDFIRMANEILKKGAGVSFLMVGDGPLRRDIEAMIDDYGISKKVILTGFQSDVPQLLGCMDVFVLNSLWEGLPRVVPQAMALGIPIVATRVDGVPEAVLHGQNGFLVSAEDFRAAAERTLELIQNPSLAKGMGETGKKMVYPEFCARRMAQNTEELYRYLLKGKSPARTEQPQRNPY